MNDFWRYILFIIVINITLILANEKYQSIDYNSMSNYVKLSKLELIDTNFITNSYMLSFDFIFNQYKDSIYYINSNLLSDGTNTFYLLGKVGSHQQTKIICDTNIKFYMAKSFALNNKNLYLLNYRNLFIFRKNGNDYLFERNIELTDGMENIYIYDDKIIGYSNNFFDPIKDTTDVPYAFYNVIDLETNKEAIHSLGIQPTSIFTIYQPRNLIDAFADKIAIIDAVGDSIAFKIHNIETETTINYKYKPNYWIPSSYETIGDLNRFFTPYYRKNVKSAIESLRPLMQKISFVSKVNFINDSTLLILATHPKKDFKYIYDFVYTMDIVTFTSTGITKIKHLSQNEENTDEPIGKNFPESWYISDSYHFCNNNLIFIKDVPPVEIEDIYNYTPKELKEKTAEYLEKNDKLPFQFIILKITNIDD